MVVSMLRKPFWFEYGLVAGLCFLLSLLFMPWLGSPVGGFMEDDSWFYAQIAFNWPRVGYPSFDGLDETSGFHLLWGGLLAMISWGLSIWTESKLVLASAIAALYLVIVWATVRLIGKGRSKGLILFIATTFLLLGAFYMETALLSLMLLVLHHSLNATSREQQSSPPFVVMFVSALCVLCRIDAVLILLVWASCLLNRRLSGYVLIGTALGIAIHFGGMFQIFGHWYSVSSQLKSNSAVHGLESGLPTDGLLVRTGLWILLTIWACSRALLAPRNAVTLGALLGTFSYTLLHLVFSNIRSWYFLPAYAVALLAATVSEPALTESRQRRQVQLVRGFAGLAIALWSYKALRFVAAEEKRIKAWSFVAEVQKRVPQKDAIYEIDASGFPGYWTERHIINGDGLVNSYDYARRLMQNDLGEYLKDEEICWLLTTARVASKSSSLLLSYGGLTLDDSQVTPVFPHSLKGSRRRTQLWKLKYPGCTSQANQNLR